jgi:hypothetical protein
MGFLRVYHRTVSLSSRAFLPYRDSLCILSDGRGSMLAADGRCAARVLLDYQTPAALVSASPLESYTVGQGRGTCMVPSAMAKT